MKKTLLREAMDRISKARHIVQARAPYSSPTLYGLVPHFLEENKKGFSLAVTEKSVLIINPWWVVEDEPEVQGKNGMEVLAGGLYHEVNHIQRDMSRFIGLKAEIARIASDLAINCTMQRAGWQLPSWVLYPDQYGLPNFKTFEWYYQALLRMNLPEQTSPGRLGAGGCGSANFNAPSPTEKELDQVLGRAPEEIQEIRIQSALKARASSPGTDAGAWEEVLSFKKEKPIIPWEHVIKRTFQRSMGGTSPGDDDVSYARQNRRNLIGNIIMPGQVAFERKALFIRDSSGSMGTEEGNQVNNQIIQIMHNVGFAAVYVVDGDVHLQGKPTLCQPRDIPRLQLKGRGGTDFRSVLDDVLKLKLKVDVTVIFTDGDGPAPRQKPKGLGHIIWCVVNSPYMRKPANWGTLVVCSNDREVLRRMGQPY